MIMIATRLALLATVCFCCRLALAPAAAEDVFAKPVQRRRQAMVERKLTALLRAKKHREAEAYLRAAVKKFPDVPSYHYNLAALQAALGRRKQALASLQKAVDKGYANPEHMTNNASLKPLQGTDAFARALKGAQEQLRRRKAELAKTKRVAPKDGVVTVGQQNTVWNAAEGGFLSFFDLPAKGAAKRPVAKGYGEAGEMLRKWQKAGTAAGLSLVLYDNRDRDHSNMHYGKFPQLTRIEYAKAAKEKNLDHGLQRWFRFNCPTIGNSSTATTSGIYWRSNPRLAMGNRNTMNLAYLHYVTNHLYFYPEHRDHDPGHNGKGGHGDVFPANTPYFIISQGSSGSDRVFMDAVAATIAAFRPETQKRLRENGVLMPTVQMIFRRANKMVKSDDDYLDGRAHPTVFTKQQLNVNRMVELAHEMKADQVPAMVQLRVLKESEPKPGVNIFVPPASEKILDTPAAIARVHHTTDYARRMRVSAAKSRDVNGHKLKFAWRLLRGDPDKVRIKPVKPDRSIVDLQISWHERRPIRPGAKMASNRVDIGVFVHNGYHWSAPGFISITFPDDEDRTYTDDHRIASITYKPKSKGGNYVDPMIVPARHWHDEYLYTDDGKLRGWKRSIGGKQQRYTRHGALMTRADDHGRPVRAVGVTYQIKRSKAKARARVTPKATKNAISYDYASDRDQLGEVAQ